jgi:hypothetical protein
MMMNLSFKKKNVFHCILCHSIALGAYVLGSKTQGRKLLIFYKIKIRTLAMNKHCEIEHFDSLKMYVNEIV